MRQDLLEIVKNLMNSGYDEKYIAQAIISLKERWPNLTETEKYEIEATAFAIYTLNYYFEPNESFPDCLYSEEENKEEDYSTDESNLEEENENYFPSSYSYENKNRPIEQEETGFQKFFRRFKRKN